VPILVRLIPETRNLVNLCANFEEFKYKDLSIRYFLNFLFSIIQYFSGGTVHTATLRGFRFKPDEPFSHPEIEFYPQVHSSGPEYNEFDK